MKEENKDKELIGVVNAAPAIPIQEVPLRDPNEQGIISLSFNGSHAARSLGATLREQMSQFKTEKTMENGENLDTNIGALRTLRKAAEEGEPQERDATLKELRGVEAEYLEGNKNAVTDYLKFNRIPSEEVNSGDPNVELWKELLKHPAIDEATLNQSLKDYQLGDNRAIVSLADRAGYDTDLTASAKASVAPARNIDSALKAFTSEKESLGERMGKGVQVMAALQGRNEELEVKISALQKEKALEKVEKKSAAVTTNPGEQSSKELKEAEGSAIKLGIPEKEISESKKNGEEEAKKTGAGESKKEGVESSALIDKSVIKRELEKSQEKGETTAKLKEIMKQIPISSLHVRVKENTEESTKLSGEIHKVLEKQHKKQQENNRSQGTKHNVSFQ